MRQFSCSIFLSAHIGYIDRSANARIVDGGDCRGAFMAWLGPVPSFGKSFSMVGAWEDPAWT